MSVMSNHRNRSSDHGGCFLVKEELNAVVIF